MITLPGAGVLHVLVRGRRRGSGDRGQGAGAGVQGTVSAGFEPGAFSIAWNAVEATADVSTPLRSAQQNERLVRVRSLLQARVVVHKGCMCG